MIDKSLLKIKINAMRFLLLILSLLFLNGCFSTRTWSTHFTQSGSTLYPKTEADTIKLYATFPELEYVVIGNVLATGNDQRQAEMLIKREAAVMGADAIAELRVNYNVFGEFSRAMIALSGIAIKFRKNIDDEFME
jgi:hypothetical protein